MVNIVEWFVSMHAMQMVVSLALTFGFAGRDYTFDESSFYVLFKKLLDLAFEFRLHL